MADSKIIKNGTVVTADLSYRADVKIKHGIITGDQARTLTGDEHARRHLAAM